MSTRGPRAPPTANPDREPTEVMRALPARVQCTPESVAEAHIDAEYVTVEETVGAGIFAFRCYFFYVVGAPPWYIWGGEMIAWVVVPPRCRVLSCMTANTRVVSWTTHFLLFISQQLPDL